MKAFLLCVVALLTASCASVNIELKPHSEKSTSVTHYSHYGLWGLVGSDSINLKQVCMGEEPVQVRNYFNFEDFLFAISTLGLFSVVVALTVSYLATIPHLMISITDFQVLLISAFGFGLYSPKSTEIWCEIPYQDNVIKL